MNASLATPVQYLKSVGPKRAEAFSTIGINTIYDLLFYFPSKYLDRSTITNTNQIFELIRSGYEDEVTIVGKVTDKDIIHYGKKNIVKVKMHDEFGDFECVWFHGTKYFKDIFNAESYYAISAKPVLTKFGHLQFVHPDFDKLAERESKDFLHTGKIIPFYRTPKELKSVNLGDYGLRRIINSALESYSTGIEETLPAFLITKHNLLSLSETVHKKHLPNSFADIEQANIRLKFEEIFYFECMLALRKSKNILSSKPITYTNILLKPFLKQLPFELTESQVNVLKEIKADLISGKSMNRLLQGDVGSGKTIVALISMLLAIESKYQTALLVPTEILAVQHFDRIKQLTLQFGIKCVLLIGGQKTVVRKEVLSDIKDGTAQIIVGTHAILEENVEFSNLGLVVIDEQHRFGVLQRSALIKKDSNPHVLLMTATPIPRTITMTLYGDLDVSIIKEAPKNRLPIKTVLRGESKLKDVYKFISDKAADGIQTFMVYPLVEESEKLELKSVITFYEQLKSNYLKHLKVGLIHGRMNWLEKENVMKDFAANNYNVLLSTTVIEVGIDIPNANIIVINDAERFGLSQLHQLRGRVGRSGAQSYCVLITSDALSAKINKFNFNFDYLSRDNVEKKKSQIRLNAMIKYSSGFELSEIDFKLRGPGNIFGTEQSGLPNFKYVNLLEDISLIEVAKHEAFEIISNDNKLTSESNSLIKNILKKHYYKNISMSHIA
jgi:ATP-dependent DNA helicase RecG